MKLIDRNKFLKDKDQPTWGERYYNKERGEYSERIYECDRNRYMMTVFESIWLYPEYTLLFKKYRKPNIWWLLLNLWCPWFDNICYTIKEDGLKLSIIDFIAILLTCSLTFCGLGPIFCIAFHYIRIKRVHERYTNGKGIDKEIFQKYKKIKFI